MTAALALDDRGTALVGIDHGEQPGRGQRPPRDVRVVAFDAGGRVLLTRVSARDEWQLPGGPVAAGEAPLAAAVRAVAGLDGWGGVAPSVAAIAHLRLALDDRPVRVAVFRRVVRAGPDGVVGHAPPETGHAPLTTPPRPGAQDAPGPEVAWWRPGDALARVSPLHAYLAVAVADPAPGLPRSTRAAPRRAGLSWVRAAFGVLPGAGVGLGAAMLVLALLAAAGSALAKRAEVGLGGPARSGTSPGSVPEVISVSLPDPWMVARGNPAALAVAVAVAWTLGIAVATLVRRHSDRGARRLWWAGLVGGNLVAGIVAPLLTLALAAG